MEPCPAATSPPSPGGRRRVEMKPSDEEEEGVEATVPQDRPTPGDSDGTDTLTTDLLRITAQMANQCLEMKAKLHAGQSKSQCSASEAERDLPDCISELENARTKHFNKSLAFHRIQIWNAIANKTMEDDSEFGVLKVLIDRCQTYCAQIQTLQKESRALEDKITAVQKGRLELKRLTHEKMKEMDELMTKQPPHMEQYRSTLQKGQSNLQKYRRMVTVLQHILQGILLACKVNWLDPSVAAIAMTLEELPILD